MDPGKMKPVYADPINLAGVNMSRHWGALEVREQWQQSDNSQGENINTTLSRPIICTVRKNIMARFIYVKIIKSRLINPRVVFTFTRQRWSSTIFSSLLTLIVWTSNVLHTPLSFYLFLTSPTLFYQRGVYYFSPWMKVGSNPFCFLLNIVSFMAAASEEGQVFDMWEECAATWEPINCRPLKSIKKDSYRWPMAYIKS